MKFLVDVNASGPTAQWLTAFREPSRKMVYPAQQLPGRLASTTAGLDVTFPEAGR